MACTSSRAWRLPRSEWSGCGRGSRQRLRSPPAASTGGLRRCSSGANPPSGHGVGCPVRPRTCGLVTTPVDANRGPIDGLDGTPHTDRYGVGLKAILLSGTCALVLSLFVTRWAIRQFAAWGLGQLIREDGPRIPPREARDAHDGRRRHRGLGGDRLRVRQAGRRGRRLRGPRCWCCSSWWAWPGWGSSTTSSRSGCSAASVSGARPSWWGRRVVSLTFGVPGARPARAGRDGGRRVAPAVPRA